MFKRISRNNFKRESARIFKWQKNILGISFVNFLMKCKTKQTTKIAHLISLNQALLFVAHWKWQNDPKHWHLYRFIDVFCALDWHETCNKKDNKEGQTVWSNNYKKKNKKKSLILSFVIVVPIFMSFQNSWGSLHKRKSNGSKLSDVVHVKYVL